MYTLENITCEDGLRRAMKVTWCDYHGGDDRGRITNSIKKDLKYIPFQVPRSCHFYLEHLLYSEAKDEN